MDDLLSTTPLSQGEFQPENALAEIDEQSNEIAELSKKARVSSNFLFPIFLTQKRFFTNSTQPCLWQMPIHMPHQV